MMSIRQEHGIDREEIFVFRDGRHTRGSASGHRHAQDAVCLSASKKDHIVPAPGTTENGTWRVADLLGSATCHIDFLQLSVGMHGEEPTVRRPKERVQPEWGLQVSQRPRGRGSQIADPNARHAIGSKRGESDPAAIR